MSDSARPVSQSHPRVNIDGEEGDGVAPAHGLERTQQALSEAADSPGALGVIGTAQEEAIPDSALADDGVGPKEPPIEPPRLRAVMPWPPTEGAGIKCSVRGARPFAAAFGATRETFDLIKFDAKGRPTDGEGEWRCGLHRPDP
jgi:hypothetical protein